MTAVAPPSDRRSLSQVTGGRSAKWPRVARPSGQGSLGQVAATAARPAVAGTGLGVRSLSRRWTGRPGSWCGPRGGLLELLDHLLVEGRDVVGLAAGDD